MFKKIVVAVDGSEHSHRALEYGQDLANRYEAAVWLVHVFPHTSDLLGYDEYEKLVARREAAGQTVLDEARQTLGTVSFPVYEELLEGPPAEAIINVAEVRGVDLIIMGTRGLGALQGLLMGSVSHKVMHHAHCPVLLVR
ncbi:MAG TPA: universal stress protein [Anaerolineae bacterium]|nr:universal stress protein [Anaerolineae bacterium]HMR63025.1 universal stress protein [Anaerolineae bacterium]